MKQHLLEAEGGGVGPEAGGQTGVGPGVDLGGEEGTLVDLGEQGGVNEEGLEGGEEKMVVIEAGVGRAGD